MKRLRFILILPLLLLVAAKIPEPNGYVNDLAGVIDPQTSAAITNLVTELKQKTTAEIAVLTVNTTDGEDIFDYSMAVADKWKVGKKGKDNGVVMVFAIQDRKMHILVGYGLEGILNDAKVGRIEDQYIVPSFKQGNYGEGILHGVQAIAKVIAPYMTIEGLPAQPEREPAPYTGNYESSKEPALKV